MLENGELIETTHAPDRVGHDTHCGGIIGGFVTYFLYKTVTLIKKNRKSLAGEKEKEKSSSCQSVHDNSLSQL